MTSKIEYLGELRTSAIHVKSGQELITDAPTDNQGKGEAFSPTDLVATSLASCMMTIMGIVAQREALDIKGLTAEVTKIMSTELPRKITKIEIKFYFTGNNITPDQQLKLKNAAYTCPVGLSLHPDIKQNIQFIW